MVVASFVIAVFALLVSGGAAFYARRQSLAADRSASADERANELAEAEAARYRPPWVLVPEDTGMFLLTNDSDEATHGVEVQTVDLFTHGPTAFERIGPGSSVRLFLISDISTEDETVRIIWSRQPGGDRIDWSRPLPRQPR